jgi:hypothetical protein
MWITILGGPYDGQGSFVAYPSLETCEAALSAVGDTLPYDHNLLCEETPTPSASMRPKRRPEGLGQ